MDVLQVIKLEHHSLRQQIHTISTALSAEQLPLVRSFCHSLRSYIELERGYLYPEVQALIPSPSAKRCNSATANRTNILSHLDSLLAEPTGDNIRRLWPSLNRMISDYLVFIEDLLMPLLRESLPSDEREDLGAHILESRSQDSSLSLA